MAGTSFNISTNLNLQMELSAGINAKVLPLLNQAVRGIAQQTAANWREAVQRASLWSSEKDQYAGSIQYRMTGDFSAQIFSDYKYVEDIENGRPPRDLKKMLDTSMKVRRTKSGTRFLIIPFRHSVADMPSHVYKEAKSLEASSVTGVGQRRSGEIVSARIGMGMRPLGENRQRQNPFASDPSTRKAAMVQKLQTNWGGRLAAGSMGPNPKGKVDRFAGMVKMQNGTAGAPRSSYLTFRVMTEKSRGWIVPAKPGQHIAAGVTNDMRPRAGAVMAEAIKRSMGGGR